MGSIKVIERNRMIKLVTKSETVSVTQRVAARQRTTELPPTVSGMFQQVAAEPIPIKTAKEAMVKKKPAFA